MLYNYNETGAKLRLLGLGIAADDYVDQYKKDCIDYPCWTSSFIVYLSEKLLSNLTRFDWKNSSDVINVDMLCEIHEEPQQLKTHNTQYMKVFCILRDFYKCNRDRLYS